MSYIYRMKESFDELTGESLNGQNLGFPRRPYFKSCAPLFSAVMAFIQKCRTSDNAINESQQATFLHDNAHKAFHLEKSEEDRQRTEMMSHIIHIYLIPVLQITSKGSTKEVDANISRLIMPVITQHTLNSQ